MTERQRRRQPATRSAGATGEGEASGAAAVRVWSAEASGTAETTAGRAGLTGDAATGAATIGGTAPAGVTRQGWSSQPVRAVQGTAAVRNTTTCALRPARESIRTAREFLAETLQHWGVTEVQESAEVVVSELVTNALHHGLGADPPDPEWPIRLKLLRKGHHVMCVVTDPSNDVPVRKSRDSEPDLEDISDLAETGRGLQIVASYSRRWGWAPLATEGKAVWALFYGRP